MNSVNELTYTLGSTAVSIKFCLLSVYLSASNPTHSSVIHVYSLNVTLDNLSAQNKIAKCNY